MTRTTEDPMVDNAFEQELVCAFRGLIANIRTSAQRATTQAVQAAFARVSHPEGELGDTVAAARSSPAPSLSRRMLTPSERAEALALTLVVVRNNPGSTIARLAKIVGRRIDSMKQHLQKLADDGAVRIEMRKVGGVPRRAYFVAEHVVNGHADGGPVAPAGATA